MYSVHSLPISLQDYLLSPLNWSLLPETQCYNFHAKLMNDSCMHCPFNLLSQIYLHACLDKTVLLHELFSSFVQFGQITIVPAINNLGWTNM